MIRNLRPIPQPQPITPATPLDPPYDWATERRASQVLLDTTVARYVLAVLAAHHPDHPHAHNEAFTHIQQAIGQGFPGFHFGALAATVWNELAHGRQGVHVFHNDA